MDTINQIQSQRASGNSFRDPSLLGGQGPCWGLLIEETLSVMGLDMAESCGPGTSSAGKDNGAEPPELYSPCAHTQTSPAAGLFCDRVPRGVSLTTFFVWLPSRARRSLRKPRRNC